MSVLKFLDCLFGGVVSEKSERITEIVESSREGVLSFLGDCIAERSYTGFEKGQADLLLSFFADRGIAAFRTPRGSVVAMVSPFREELSGTFRENPGPAAFLEHLALLRERNVRSIAFNAHMDVVSEGDPSSWTTPPFLLSVREGRLFGRGSCDMKGAMVAMAESMAIADGNRLPLRFGVLGCFVTEEELAEGLAMEEIVGELGIVPDMVVLGEPSANRISLGQRGKAQFSLSFNGVRVHSSQPERGVNAAYPAAADILSIDRLNRRELEEFGDDLMKRTTVAVTGMEALPGDASSVVSFARVDAIARLAWGETLDSLLAKLAKDDGWRNPDRVSPFVYDRPSYSGVRRDWTVCHKAWRTPADSDLAAFASGAFSEVMGRDPEFIVWPFSTDGVTTASRHGIPTIGIGPGLEEMCHKPDEFVGERDFFDALRIYVCMISK